MIDADGSLDALEQCVREAAQIHGIRLLKLRLDEEALGEVRRFGIETVEALTPLLNADVLRPLAEGESRKTALGFLRLALMLEDIERYFDQSWRPGMWDVPSRETTHILKAHYGSVLVNQMYSRFPRLD